MVLLMMETLARLVGLLMAMVLMLVAWQGFYWQRQAAHWLGRR